MKKNHKPSYTFLPVYYYILQAPKTQLKKSLQLFLPETNTSETELQQRPIPPMTENEKKAAH